MLHRRVLSIVLLLLGLLAACSPAIPPVATSAPTAVPPPAPQSGIRGIVLVGPACPVVQADKPCPDRPYPATLAVLDQAGQEIARFQASADGNFQLTLPPGAYTLEPQPPKDSPLPRPQGSIAVTVTAGEYVSVTVLYDSGIR